MPLCSCALVGSLAFQNSTTALLVPAPTALCYNSGIMPALDQYHTVVRHALEKDGWTITDDPLTLRVGVDRIHIDLAAERLIIAEKGIQRIAVEIKTFAGASKIANLEDALGQYVLYRMALRRTEPGRELYLAVPQSVVVNQFQSRELWQAFFTDENGKVVGYDVEREEIVQWLP